MYLYYLTTDNICEGVTTTTLQKYDAYKAGDYNTLQKYDAYKSW